MILTDLAMPEMSGWVVVEAVRERAPGAVDQSGTVADGGTFNYPAFTIEAAWNRAVQAIWRNELVGANGHFLPTCCRSIPPCPYPPGSLAGRDRRPTLATTPGPYTGPVPIVTLCMGRTPRRTSPPASPDRRLGWRSTIASAFLGPPAMTL